MSRSGKINQVILIMLDDIRASHLFNLIAEGKLPNLAKLAEKGVSCNNCITSFPSVTFPSYPNIITGAYSGYFPVEGSGIPGYHWIARNDPPAESKKFPIIRNYDMRNHLWKISKDLGKNCKTIFEQAGEGNFLSSLNLIFRGSQFIAPLEYTSELIFKKAEEVLINPKDFYPSKEIPKVSVIYIPQTDELMHDKGYDHFEYINEIIKIDEYIGNLIKLLKKLGLTNDTAIAVITDHGNYKSQIVYDIEPFFHKLGLRQYDPKTGEGDFDANIGGIGFFNFRGDTWHHHPGNEQMRNFKTSGINSNDINLFEELWKIPGVKYMYYRDDNNTPDKGIIHLEKRSQKSGKIIKGRIEYEGHGKHQQTKYLYEEDELFGYSKFEDSSTILDTNFHNIDEWLSVTNKIDFPMLIDQIPRYFKNPRACDIMFSTCGEYGFNYEHGKTVNDHAFSHDIAIKKSMTVPFIIGGSPEIPNLKLEYCKTTDMVPTLLDLLGIKPHSSVVGRSVIN